MLVHVDEGEWSSLLTDLSELFSATELEDGKALYKVGSGEPAVGDFCEIRSLRRLIALDRSDWLLSMLLDQRLTSVFQPIVWASNPTEIYAQECLLRGNGTNGCLLPAEQILNAAGASGLLAQTDLAARHAAIREAVRHGVKSRLFVNLAPTSVYDPARCLRSTVKAVDAAGIPREKVIFELTETEEAADVHSLKALADHLRGGGFRVALDDVGAGYSSLNILHRLRPDFIKLDIGLIRGVDQDPYKATIAQKLIEIAYDLGISAIAEGVETPGEMGWVRANGATFAQGWFVARPVRPPVQRVSTPASEEEAPPRAPA